MQWILGVNVNIGDSLRTHLSHGNIIFIEQKTLCRTIFFESGQILTIFDHAIYSLPSQHVDA